MLKEYAFHLLRTVASQERRNGLKAYLHRTRARAAPILRTVHGTYGEAELEAHLRSALPGDFEILMVHSSFSHMLPMFTGGPMGIINVLQRLAGNERTLAMPAFFFGDGVLTNHRYYREHPTFDARRTPSQMGLVTDLFRRRPTVVRSLHPTHSVCATGPLARALCGSHHLSPHAFGPLSPFAIMARRSTVILGMGLPYYRSLTQVHAVEDLAPRFPLPRDASLETKVRLVDLDGGAIDYIMAAPVSSDYTIRIDRLAQLLNAGDLEAWKFRGTPFYVTTAAAVTEALLRAAARGETLYVRQVGPRSAGKDSFGGAPDALSGSKTAAQ